MQYLQSNRFNGKYLINRKKKKRKKSLFKSDATKTDGKT